MGEGGRRLAQQPSQHRNGPLVTIITVAFNAAATIEQAIRSVLAQDYPEIEYIVIDGGSSDQTLEILQRFDSAIDYFVSEPDNGLYHAMNKGIELASGDYILMLNADDWYEPNCVRLLLEGLSASGADFSAALANYVDEANNTARVLPRMPYDESMYFGMSLRHELMLVPKAAYASIGGYDQSYRIIADFDFSIRLFKAGYRAYQLNRPLLNFRVTGVSNMQRDKLVAEHRRFLSHSFPEIREEVLVTLADSGQLSADVLDKALAAGNGQIGFINALVAYGFRRGFYSADRPPAIPTEVPVLVSVIVPAYNAAATLPACLHSVLSQGYPWLEILCIDDGSTDDTPSILKAITAKDSRVRGIFNQRNAGVSYCRNLGVQSAKGKYLFFLDADDELADDSIAQLVHAAEKYGSDIVRARYQKISLDGAVLSVSMLPNVKKQINTSLQGSPDLLKTTEGFWCALYRKAIAANCLFDQRLKVGEDSLFLVNVYLSAAKITLLDRVIYRYRQHADSAMKNWDADKFENAIEWRERAWALLSQQGMPATANWLAHDYWNPAFIKDIGKLPQADQKRILNRLSKLLEKTGFPGVTPGNAELNLHHFSEALHRVRTPVAPANERAGKSIYARLRSYIVALLKSPSP